LRAAAERVVAVGAGLRRRGRRCPKQAPAGRTRRRAARAAASPARRRPNPDVSFFWPAPVACITHSSRVPPRLLENAIVLPSGDQTGSRSSLRSTVSRPRPPSGG
jgi:hypothetical protein